MSMTIQQVKAAAELNDGLALVREAMEYTAAQAPEHAERAARTLAAFEAFATKEWMAKVGQGRLSTGTEWLRAAMADGMSLPK